MVTPASDEALLQVVASAFPSAWLPPALAGPVLLGRFRFPWSFSRGPFSRLRTLLPPLRFPGPAAWLLSPLQRRPYGVPLQSASAPFLDQEWIHGLPFP